MRALLLSLLLATAPAFAGTTPVLMYGKTADDLVVQAHANLAWTLACAAKRARCDRIEPPDVEFDINEPGLWGRYRIGSGSVRVAERLRGDVFALLIMAHEMVHYLQWQTGQLSAPKSHELHCRSEKEAFDITAQIAKAIGLDEDWRLESWSDTHGLYGCTLDGAPAPQEREAH